MSTHELKIWPEFFNAVITGKKLAEVRKDDRGFQVGDTLILNEYDNLRSEYTGRSTVREVTYITRGIAGIAPGYCVLSIDGPRTEPWETSL